MKKMTKAGINYFAVYYISIAMFVLCASAGFGAGIVLCKIIAMISFAAFILKKDGMGVDFEKAVLLVFGCLFFILVLINGGAWGAYKFLDILCGTVLMAVAIAYFIRKRGSINMAQWFGTNGGILLVIFAFVLLSSEIVGAWLMWDAHAYFASVQGIIKRFDTDLSGVYGLYLVGHATLGYSLWLVLFQLFKSGSEMVQIADIALAAISIYAFYQIMRNLLGDKCSDRQLVLASVPYALSPFVLGIEGYFNIDSAVMYFGIIFIACSLYRYECLELVLAGLFCFTKEPAVIYYAAYVAVKIFCEYLSERPFRFWQFVKFGLTDVKNYFYALPAAVWVALFMLNSSSGWGGSGGIQNKHGGFFRMRTANVVMRLKQIFLVNFNWMFWAVIIVGVIVLLMRKRRLNKEILKKLLPICAMGAAVFIFGFCYITYTNLRYIAPAIPVIYLTAAVLAANLSIRAEVVRNILMSVLLLVQSFYSIDPVMRCAFESMSVGSGTIYGMGESNSTDFHDYVVYNRQYMYWQKVLTDILAEAGYNGDMLIVFPGAVSSGLRNMIGNQGVSLWNVQKGTHEYFDPVEGVPEQCVFMKTCVVRDVENMLNSDYEGYFDGDYILYIVPSWAKINEGFVDGKTIIKQGEVRYRGYRASYMVMDAGAFRQNAILPDGRYTASPKQDSSLRLGTDGKEIALTKTGETFLMLSELVRDNYGLEEELERQMLPIITVYYQLIFEDYEVALDLPENRLDENGRVSVWEVNDSEAQKWILEKNGEYYMICWAEYALTYDLGSNSLKLAKRSGEDNQLWKFERVSE